MQSKAPVLVAICGRSDEANRRLSKLLGEFEPLLKGRLEVLYVNAEAVLALADRLGVQWVPGLVVFSRGALCYQFMGDAVRSDLEELLARVSALTENTGVGATPGGSQGMSNGEAWLSHRNDS
jgi:thioredoxin-like negative regulator of GroEL